VAAEQKDRLRRVDVRGAGVVGQISVTESVERNGTGAAETVATPGEARPAPPRRWAQASFAALTARSANKLSRIVRRMAVPREGEYNIRFIRNKTNTVIYAIFLGWPVRPAPIGSMGLASQTNPGKIVNATVLGLDEKIKWTQDADVLKLELPRHSWQANDYGAEVRIALSRDSTNSPVKCFSK